MKNIIYLTTVLCICIMGMYSCKKNNPIPHKIIDAHLKGAFDFQPGTYWIFKDSLTGQVDSFYVRNNWNSIYTNASPSYTYDGITVDIKEVNELPIGSDTARWGIGLAQNQLAFSDYYKDDFFNYDAIIYPFTSGIQPYDVYPESIILMSSFSINNSTIFNNVAEICYSGGVNDFFYLNSDVGLIKIVLNQRDAIRVWELQRWNIVK